MRGRVLTLRSMLSASLALSFSSNSASGVISMISLSLAASACDLSSVVLSSEYCRANLEPRRGKASLDERAIVLDDSEAVQERKAWRTYTGAFMMAQLLWRCKTRVKFFGRNNVGSGYVFEEVGLTEQAHRGSDSCSHNCRVISSRGTRVRFSRASKY